MSIGANDGLEIERRAWAGRDVWGHPGSTMAYISSTWVDAGMGVTVTTCVTRVTSVAAADADIRYPRAQLFSMALNTGYALANRFREKTVHRTESVRPRASVQA